MPRDLVRTGAATVAENATNSPPFSLKYLKKISKVRLAVFEFLSCREKRWISMPVDNVSMVLVA